MIWISLNQGRWHYHQCWHPILSFRSDSFSTWCVKTTCAYSLYDMGGVGITVWRQTTQPLQRLLPVRRWWWFTSWAPLLQPPPKKNLWRHFRRGFASRGKIPKNPRVRVFLVRICWGCDTLSAKGLKFIGNVKTCSSGFPKTTSMNYTCMIEGIALNWYQLTKKQARQNTELVASGNGSFRQQSANVYRNCVWSWWRWPCWTQTRLSGQQVTPRSSK